MKVTAKRRRSRQQVQDDKREEKLQKQRLKEKVEQTEMLEQELRAMKSKIQKTEEDADQIRAFFDAGLLVQDENGIPQLADQGTKSKKIKPNILEIYDESPSNQESMIGELPNQHMQQRDIQIEGLQQQNYEVDKQDGERQ